MPTPAQLTAVSNGIASIRSAQTGLVVAGRNTNDPVVLANINNEYANLQSVLVQLVQAQVIQDDTTFQTAAATLNAEAGALNAQAAAINGIVNDVQLAAKIAGYIAQAAGILAGL